MATFMPLRTTSFNWDSHRSPTFLLRTPATKCFLVSSSHDNVTDPISLPLQNPCPIPSLHPFHKERRRNSTLSVSIFFFSKMRLIHFCDAAKNLAKRTLIHHSQQNHHHQQYFSSFSKLISPCKGSLNGIPGTQNQNSSLGSLIRKSYYSSSPPPRPSNGRKLGFLSWYLAMLESRPILTKAVSCSIIYAAADITSQMITMQPSGSLDLIRTFRMASYGLLILGPSQHVWFNFIGRSLPKRDIVTTLKKLMAGQLVFGPTVTSVFFSFNAALQGEDANQIAARLKRDMLPTLLNGLMFWPLCDFLTYKVIPVHLQPLANSSFAYIWTIYLTYMASLEKAVN